MGLDVPDLDDRTYEALIEDATKRIPVHAPEWTDHNAHDPGITILELLAWLAETYGYQLDQLTDDHRRKYLGLVGVRPRPPRPARVALSVQVPDDHAGPDESAATGEADEPATIGDATDERATIGDATDESATIGDATDESAATGDATDEAETHVLAAGAQVIAETPSRAHVAFETEEAVPLTRASIDAVVSEHERGRTDHTSDNETEGRSFLAFGRDAKPGNAMYLGFDRDPFEDAGRLALVFEFPDEPLVDAVGRTDDPDLQPSLEGRWEYCTRLDDWYHDDAWAAIDVVDDDTTHFYRGGRVELEVPDGWPETTEAARILGRDEELYWLRCRLDQRSPPEAEPVPLAGLSSPELTEPYASLKPCSPPFENGDSTADGGEAIALPRRRERYEIPPRFAAVRTNVVPARHRERDTGVRLERRERGGSVPGYDRLETTARPAQRFAFPDAPVEAADLVVGEEPWKRVDDFDESGPNDRHYVLERDAGVVQFGNGRRGAIPPVRRGVVATSVVHSGGPAGNVSAGSTWRFTAEAYRPLAVEPLTPPTGGRGAESVADAVTRAREEQRVPHRAVTASDFRELAARTPIVQVERAAVIAHRCEGDPTPEGNHVTVVVIPRSPPYRRRAIPTRGFLDAVERYLCRRSLLSDRVSVVPPTYVGVRIRAEVDVADGHAPATVRETAETELTSFLDPLEGFDGDGWPFDRPVHTSELYERLESVRGVEDAVDVSVAVGEGPDLATDRTALPYPESVTVSVTEDRRRCGRGF